MTLATTLQRRRKQVASATIAQTALDLFVRDGFQATSVETIATAAGCSPRTFYRYFRSKEETLFYDLPQVLEQLGTVLEEHLAQGLGAWEAVTETVVAFIRRFDNEDPLTATRRLRLWLSEPSLRARYMQYIARSEQLIADTLHRHAGTDPDRDDLPQLIAVAATGAYRAVIFAPGDARTGRTLARHLRDALRLVGEGLADNRRR